MSQLTQALAAWPPEAKTLVVAYSGGRDSTALLHALCQIDRPMPVRAVHVCHHLEPEALSWDRHCQAFCRRQQVSLTRLDVHVAANGAGLEAEARQARYAALQAHLQADEVLVTAHHAEDQAETFLLQALRGSGVAGLAAMPELKSFGQGQLWRPWLHMPRDWITAYARDRALPWVEDGSNLDTERARGYLRRHVWPALTAQWPAAARTLARSAGWIGQAREAIDELAQMDLQNAQTGSQSLAISALQSLSAGRLSQVVQLWLVENRLDPPTHRHIGEIIKLLTAREHASPRVVYADTEIRRFDQQLYCMTRLPPAPVYTVWPWPAGQAGLALPRGCGWLSMHAPMAADLDVSALQVVLAGQGERIKRADGREMALSELLRQKRVPPWIRQRLPRLYWADTLIAVPGIWTHPRLAGFFAGMSVHWYWRHDLVGGFASRPD